MQVTASIFKAYDIRGIVPSTLNEQVAEGLGRAFGTVALAEGQTTVAVGRDGRLSGPMLSAALIRGLMAAGVRVIDVGLCTTPMLYFAASTLCASGIQVTGSHNPKDYNGFKMVLAGRAIYGDEIQNLRRLMETEGWQLRAGGSVAQADVLSDYTRRITGDVKLSRPMKIVIDSGNGIAGASAPAIFRALGCEVIELFSEVDGDFPNHHPDPSKPENLQDLIRALQTTDAELGLAFDGDGDRLGIVTKDGHNIFPDRQMQLFAQDVLSRVPGGTILFDVKCSQRLAPAIEAAGGQPLMYKTGHSLIKAQMRAIEAQGGPLGGDGGRVETSGHRLTISPSARVSTAAGASGQGGLWLLDPTDVVINDATAIQNALASGDVTVSTTGAGTDTGNISVNVPISWSSAQRLSLPSQALNLQKLDQQNRPCRHRHDHQHQGHEADHRIAIRPKLP